MNDDPNTLTFDKLMQVNADLEAKLGPMSPPKEVWVSSSLKPRYIAEIVTPLGSVILMSADRFHEALRLAAPPGSGGLYVVAPAIRPGGHDTMLGLPVIHIP